jgi:tetratricopeptide (TPR) repeat protein
MSRLKRLISEIHHRSLWQVLGIYAVGGWIAYEIVWTFTESLGLPDWFPVLALVLLIVGLTVVLALAFVPVEGVPAPTPDEVAPPIELERGVAEAETVATRRRLLTWRNAVLSFVGALALAVVVLTGWVVLGGTGFLLTIAAAAGFVGPEDCIVVAEFENETERPALAATVRDGVVTVLSQSGYVSVLGSGRVRETLGLMRLPDTTRVDETLAQEIARRENCPAVVSGIVAPLGTGYSLTAAIIEVSTGTEVKRLNETAADETEVIGAVEGLARLVRRHLGESLPSIRRSERLYRVTTNSLEALELFTLGLRRWDVQGDEAGAVPLLERAVAVDTAFAEAYRKLSSAYSNLGDPVAARRYADLAYRSRERLTSLNRLVTVAQYHWARGRFDSAVYYYRIGTERYPNDWGAVRTNLGVVYSAMGRFEEALQVWLEVAEMRDWYGDGVNVADVSRTLNHHALADSALAFLRERLPPEHYEILQAAAWNAYYAGDLLLADSLAREMANDSSARLAVGGRLLLAGLASMYGRVNQALALADSAARLAFEGSPTGWPARRTLQLTEYTSLAAGAPERALPHLENSRSQLTLGNITFEAHSLLGQVASGYALAGDVQSARELLAVMDSLAEGDYFRPTGIGEQVLAVIALQEGRPEDAVEQLRRARAAEFGLHRWEVRWLLAEAHAALGHLDEAIAQYDTLTGTYRLYNRDLFVSFPLRPVAHERLGSLYLQVGDTVAAARHLASFIDLWRDADPELQPRVESARWLLAQLAAEESR